MTFGYRLTVIIPRWQQLDSEEEEIAIELAEPVGRVTVRSSPSGVSFKDAKELIFIGSGLETLAAARRAGETLKNAIRLAAADAHVAIDVGKDIYRTRLGPEAAAEIAKYGIQALDDVHGLHVYEEELGDRRVFSARAELQVGKSLTSFVDALIGHSGRAEDLSDKRALACGLYAESHFEASEKNRHLTLVTALEVLAERGERSGLARQLVEEFIDAVVRARESADGGVRDALTSLLGAAEDLRRESIGSAVRRLVASVPPAGGMRPSRIVSDSYGARSELTHGGTTSRDLAALSGPLSELVRSLALINLNSIRPEPPE